MMMTTTLNVVGAAVAHFWKPRAQNPNRLGQNGQGGLDGLNLWPRLRGPVLVSNGIAFTKQCTTDCCWCQCWCWWRRW